MGLDSMNKLVIYEKAGDNRVLDVKEYARSIPLPTWWKGYDSDTMTFRVTVNVYDEGDFDPDTDLLTTVACDKYGVAVEDKSKYLKDQTLAELSEHYIWNEATDQPVYSPVVVADQPRYLDVTMNPSDLIDEGAGPYGLDAVPTMEALYKEGHWRDGYSFSLSGIPMTVKVTQRKSDGTVDTSANHNVILLADKGILYSYVLVLNNGIAQFPWIPGIETGLVVFTAVPETPQTPHVKAGSLKMWVKYDSLAWPTQKTTKTFLADIHTFIPGSLSPTGGPGSDGIVGQFKIGVPPSISGYDYAVVRLCSVRIFSFTTLTGTLTIKFIGQDSKNEVTVNVTTGNFFYEANVEDDSFDVGEIVDVKVTAAGGASDVTVHTRWM